jgi:hypothetical protein
VTAVDQSIQTQEGATECSSAIGESNFGRGHLSALRFAAQVSCSGQSYIVEPFSSNATDVRNGALRNAHGAHREDVVGHRLREESQNPSFSLDEITYSAINPQVPPAPLILPGGIGWLVVGIITVAASPPNVVFINEYRECDIAELWRRSDCKSHRIFSHHRKQRPSAGILTHGDAGQ